MCLDVELNLCCQTVDLCAQYSVNGEWGETHGAVRLVSVWGLRMPAGWVIVNLSYRNNSYQSIYILSFSEGICIEWIVCSWLSMPTPTQIWFFLFILLQNNDCTFFERCMPDAERSMMCFNNDPTCRRYRCEGDALMPPGQLLYKSLFYSLRNKVQ